jgi:hypothetical protein
MYIYKSYIDDYIKCPYYFGLKLLNKTNDEDISTAELSDTFKKFTKSRTYKVITKSNIKKNILWLKDIISKIAIVEMETGNKFGVAEYRIQYTNKFFKNILSTHTSIESTDLISRLNDLFSIFSNNVFLGYNVPIEIPITGTSVIYRNVIDFMMCDVDDAEKITIVEIDDLSTDLQMRKYQEWPHYKLPYHFLAESMKCDIKVIIIDPINTANRIELLYKSKQFNEVNELCGKIIVDVINPVLYKNLHSCSFCDCDGLCFPKKDK